MRRIATLLVALIGCGLWAQPASAAWSVVGSASAGSTDGTNATTAGFDTTGANFIAICLSGVTGSTAPTDNKSNTYTARTRYSSGGVGIVLYYVQAPTVGSGHTFTISSGGSVPSIFAIALSGSDVTPFDVENGGNGAGVTSHQPGSVTPSVDNELLISCLNYADTTTISINSSFTLPVQEPLVGGQHYGGALAYKIQTSAGAENPTWSWTNVSSVSAGIYTFKASSGGSSPASTPNYLTLLGVGAAILLGIWSMSGWALWQMQQRFERDQRLIALQLEPEYVMVHRAIR